MKYFDWNSQKNEKLREERDIGFEECLLAIEQGKILDILEHKNKKKYPNQKIFVLEISGYAYLVLFVEDKDKVFLKTIIPSRKATKEYLLKIKNK